MPFVRLPCVPLGVTMLCSSKQSKSVNRKLKTSQCCVSAEQEALCSANEESLQSPDLGLVSQSLLQLSQINQTHILPCAVCVCAAPFVVQMNKTVHNVVYTEIDVN